MSACDVSVVKGDIPSTVRETGNRVEDSYRVKWVVRSGEHIPICLQNANGPCPLLAIANVLLLRGNITLEPGQEVVGHNHLEMLLTEFLYHANEHLSKGPDLDVAVNSQMHLAEVVAMLPELRRGIDVNVRFFAPEAFEFTRELACFDLFRVRLLHGWLIDPQESELIEAVGDLSFNQAMDLLVNAGSVDDGAWNGVELREVQDMDRNRVALIETFLSDNTSQLTPYGLKMVTSDLQEDEYCVFFRNNHFSTATKHNNHLHILVSDVGFVNENNIVWEKLLSVSGDSAFVNGDFRPFDQISSSNRYLEGSEPAGTMAHSDENDEDFAKRLQAQESALASARSGTSSADEQLARQLQGAALESQNHPRRRSRPRPSPPNYESSSSPGNCSLM
uniref:MINDY deubiquitinase domain-containing protein n=1 Tax=Compsopogon caeruleus TaxID=31354 RepID=A0A7S1XE72_9RHOD|mmetsp:Transcript_4503/g.8985  ORF Transcript_4503/g.8985 Transcript_4503/m.8985 type:complete len:391 (+) Transcript_4503:270-1442(+)|eukprot:CAMPEP_0184678584 /NCGR_PEP_ID=MMETSP0312-20130426/1335_1 /TAXON_ID=31354 /ORGANISM="Compsopogon coeruleus, Strain SAG 36.94" /LENGTH=390 /DNA_ID=CAMNT_0027127419 /DNA_START=259 /DNA_END=1431 /DNA_ORIENTATION=-